MKRAARTRKPPTIAFLASQLDEPYQNAVWSGAAAEAERLGASIVFFGGQRVGGAAGGDALDDIVFDLAARSDVAAVAVLTSVLGSYLTQDQLAAFLRRFRDKPVVSVGVNMPDIDSVRIDNSGGMSAVADHLVQAHGRRRFLFLAGPAYHPESAAREAEFRARVGALLGTDLYAGFNPSLTGGDCFLVVEHCDFQEDAAYERTARLIAEGLRLDAVAAANDLMAMGALRALAESGVDVPGGVSVTGFDDSEDSRFSVPPLTTVRQNASDLGREAVRRLALRLGLLPEDASGAGPAVSFVVRESCGCASKTERGDLARLAAAEGVARHQAALRRAAERRAVVLREIEASLVASFSMPDILSEVARGTRALGISACRLALFESEGEKPEWARLLLAADGERTRILAPYGLRFRTADFLPDGLPERWNAYVCQPLRFGEERLGYLVCTADGTDRRVFAALRDQVSSAIKGALLMAAERDRERRLELEVRSRTVELSKANSRLKDEIARRSALERELLDISNDIMGRIGRDIHDDLCQDIAHIGLMAALLEGNLRRADNSDRQAIGSAAAIAEAAGRTAALAKGIARGLYPAELEAKGLVDAVSELVRSSRGRSDARVELEVTSGFALKDSEKALQLYRIIQEALANAVAHSRAKTITVSLRMDRETVLVEVADDGIGREAASGRRSSGGMGLRIMKYRASVIGGEFRVRSTPGAGFSVSCRLAR